MIRVGDGELSGLIEVRRHLAAGYNRFYLCSAHRNAVDWQTIHADPKAWWANPWEQLYSGWLPVGRKSRCWTTTRLPEGLRAVFAFAADLARMSMYARPARKANAVFVTNSVCQHGSAADEATSNSCRCGLPGCDDEEVLARGRQRRSCIDAPYPDYGGLIYVTVWLRIIVGCSDVQK